MGGPGHPRLRTSACLQGCPPHTCPVSAPLTQPGTLCGQPTPHVLWLGVTGTDATTSPQCTQALAQCTPRLRTLGRGPCSGLGQESPAPGHPTHLWAEQGPDSGSHLRVWASTEPLLPEGSVDEGRNLPMGSAQRVRRKGPTPKAQKATLMASAGTCYSAGATVEVVGQSQTLRSRSCPQPPGTKGDSRASAEHTRGPTLVRLRAQQPMGSPVPPQCCPTCAGAPGWGFRSR